MYNKGRSTSQGQRPQLFHHKSLVSSQSLGGSGCSSSDLIDFQTLDDFDVLSLFDPLCRKVVVVNDDSNASDSSPDPQISKRFSTNSASSSSSSTLSSDSTSPVSLAQDPLAGHQREETLSNRSSLKSNQNEDSGISSNRSSMIRGNNRLKGKIILSRRSVRSCDELEDFVAWFKDLRSGYEFTDVKTNAGLVVSSKLETQRDDSLSVKLVIGSCFSESPVMFTCNVNTSIEHIISHVVCCLVDEVANIDLNSYILRVFARNEFLESDSTLADYSYVFECHKFDRDVLLTLVNLNQVDRLFARTEKDDSEFLQNATTDSLLPSKLVSKFQEVDYNTISILIETLDREMDRVLENCRTEQKIRYHQARQAVQAISALCGKIETEPLRQSMQDFTSRVKKLSELKQSESTNCVVDPSTMDLIESAVQNVYNSVTEIIQLYAQTFPVDFTIESAGPVPRPVSNFKTSAECHEDIICWIGQLSQPDLDWASNYRKFYMLIELWHGNKKLSATRTQAQYQSESFSKFPLIQFEEWVTFEGVAMSRLPRETSIYFSLIGVQYVDPEVGSQSPKREISCSLSLCMLRIFDSNQRLVQGIRLMPMWRQETFADNPDKKFSINCHNYDPNAPLITISFPEFEYEIKFPNQIKKAERQHTRPTSASIRLLDSATQTDIYQVLNRDPIEGLRHEDQQLLWDHRDSLIHRPSALPHVLQAVREWDFASLYDVYSLINKWSQLSVIDAMQLLLHSYPDVIVRKKAVQWISSIGHDGLCDFLPQLVQALRFEPYLDSPLIWYFLQTSLQSVRVAHQLYWLLKENIDDPLLGFRCSIVLNALLSCCGQALRSMISNEEIFQRRLTDVNECVKRAKENSRLSFLHHVLEPVDEFLKSLEKGVSLPLSPSIIVKGLVISNCSYFTSNTLPLRLSFMPTEANRPESITETIFKIGDDLRQDTLTMQIIRIMEKLWLKEGLDLKIVSFNCISTDERKGFVEMVPNSETLRKIQQEQGIGGSFNERSIVDWLRKHNTNELDFMKAQENFTSSCAGYAVATYVLGICDRHNDNIMITTSGHLFHIDFGKFLGDAQMVGTIRRDRVPFVLTSDMAFVINGGSESSKQFQSFVELCCQAFNIVRRHSNLFLSLFSLMTSASIPGVTSESVKYVHKALSPELSESEATANFTRKIEESLKSKSVQLNFFVHTLGQMRFTGDHNDQRILSFVPKTCTKDTDGRIKSCYAVSFHKKYEPDKQYYHIIRVERSYQPDPSYVSRSYPEFYEFYQKLQSIFPLASFSPLPAPTSTFSRSNTQEMAEKRKKNISKFLSQLMGSSEEISHSDIVYTFFQPLLRDQELAADSIMRQRGRSPPQERQHSMPGGEVKLTLHYKNNSLIVMVMHAKNLKSRISPEKQPNTYVKTKLTPDPRNETKRKTKVASRNSDPVFMELVVYREALAVVKEKMLNVSVWESDRVHGNTYIGASLIPLCQMDLTQETVSWFPFTG